MEALLVARERPDANDADLIDAFRRELGLGLVDASNETLRWNWSVGVPATGDWSGPPPPDAAIISSSCIEALLVARERPDANADLIDAFRRKLGLGLMDASSETLRWNWSDMIDVDRRRLELGLVDGSNDTFR